jgi:hypothetical protein
MMDMKLFLCNAEDKDIFNHDRSYFTCNSQHASDCNKFAITAYCTAPLSRPTS